MKKCWICGSCANTGEHIIKKSNIVQAFGRGPYRKGNLLIKYRDTETTFLQSPNSDHLKFHFTLCHLCNTTKTQPFDRSYEIFTNYINREASEIIEYRQINLRRIFTHNHYEKRADLFKYFVKIFGCCLASHDLPVPLDLSKSMIDKSLPTGFGLIFSILKDSKKQPSGIFMVQDLEYTQDNLTGEYVNFIWAQSYNWLSVIYKYEYFKNSNIKNLWAGTKSKIPLGYIDTNIEIS